MIQQNLPQDAKPLSSNIYIDDDGMLWTGVSGGFVAFTPKSYVDTEIEDVDINVTPADLNISTPQTSGWRIPSVQTNSFTGGIHADYAYTPGGERYTLPVRDNGRLAVADAVAPYDAVTRRQLDVVSEQIDNKNTGATIESDEQTRMMLSSGSTIRNRTKQILVSNSTNAEVDTDTERITIMASRNASLGGLRMNSAIIASDNAEMERWGGGGFPASYKWNSVIIASLNARMRPHVSYGLLTGQGTVSTGSATVTMGLYNIIDPDRSVTHPEKKTLLIGNGGNTEALERSNAFYVTHGGKAWVQNEFEVDSPDGIVLRSPDQSRWRLQVDNDGNINTTKI